MAIDRRGLRDIHGPMFRPSFPALLRVACIGACCLIGSAHPLWAGEPILSVDITTRAGEPFDDAVDILHRAGARATSLSLFWDDLEPGGSGYDPQSDWPAIANAYYPQTGLRLSVTFSVIDTVADRRRRDLQGRRWDDPVLIAAFQTHLRDVLGRMPEVDIAVIAIGNEIDGLLHRPEQIAAFARLVAAARDTVDQIRPGVPVGAKLTYGGVVADPGKWRPVLAASTAMLLTYYPLNADFSIRPPGDLSGDLDRMMGFDPQLPIYLLEAGHPSDGCGSSAGSQREFVQTLLRETDLRSKRFRLVSLTWLTDITEAERAEYVRYYGVSAPCFSSYLGSLGLRRQSGAFKPALDWLISGG